MPTRIGFLLLMFFLAQSLAAAGAAPGQPQLVDVEGRKHCPLQAADKKAIVCIFTTHDCPIANSYVPEINRLYETCKPKNIAFYVIHVDPDLTREEARKHVREYGLRCPVLLDRTHALVKRTGATVTPEAVVLMPDGKAAYRGRIDDRYLDFGKKRDEPTTHDLRDALDAVLKGKRVANPLTKAVGCFIPRLEEKKR